MTRAHEQAALYTTLGTPLTRHRACLRILHALTRPQAMAAAAKTLAGLEKQREVAWKQDRAIMLDRVRGLEATREVLRKEREEATAAFKAEQAAREEAAGEGGDDDGTAARSRRRGHGRSRAHTADSRFWTQIAALEAAEAETCVRTRLQRAGWAFGSSWQAVVAALLQARAVARGLRGVGVGVTRATA